MTGNCPAACIPGGWGARLLLVAVLLTLIAAVIGLYGAQYYRSAGPLDAERTVIIPAGAGLRGIAENLNKAGIIEHPMLFKMAARLRGDSRLLKAGEYAFAAAASPQSILDMMAQGNTVVRKLTVPEGLTTPEILAIVKTAEGLTGEAPSAIPTGELLPETYHYSYGDSAAKIIARMQESMKALLSKEWETRAQGLPYATPGEALTLASIVEKETGVTEERARVAAVFINRLKLGMRLQADPTVVFGITNGERELGRELTRADLEAPTPYNTYVIDGLPPGPICNPGRAAILAALHPADSKDLYFVADGKGNHRFAASLTEHNRNVNMYRAEE